MDMNQKIFTRIRAMPIILALFLLILASFTISLTSAEVTELNVTPEVVVQGETLSISGRASPYEAVWINSSFELSLPVSADGKYRREFFDIEFPRGEKSFAVTAENIKNIRASLYPVFWQTIEYPMEGPLNATNGTATISISFPVTWDDMTIDIYGKKEVKVYGDAADDAISVHLKVAMSIKVVADENGDFSLDISTEGVPTGEFLITAGAIEKTIRIVPLDTTPPASITNLHNITYEQAYIYWTWNDPVDEDFSHVMVYLNGSFKENVSRGVQCYNATGLAPDTEYTAGTRTVDASENSNETWVNHTAKTAPPHDTTPPPAPVISSSTHPDEDAGYCNRNPTFTWTTPPDASGIACYNYVLDHTSATTPDETCNTTKNTKSYTDLAYETWYFHVRAKDNAGNWGPADHYRVQIENCNDYDGWADTGDTRWIDDQEDECKEKEQKEQEYRDYTCSGGGCEYCVTDTSWVDTGNTRERIRGIDVSPDNCTMNISEEKQFSAIATLTSGGTEDVTTNASWSSSNTSVLEHLEGGKFKAKREGSAEVITNYCNKSNKSIVEVNASEKLVFDTGSGTYPSISGTHNGTITPNQTITVSQLYTYPCPGTGGHTEYVRIWGNGINKSASWNGYSGDWYNISFNHSFTLEKGKTYNYTIHTGSYPQIIHQHEANVTGGAITCTEFVDANGKIYKDYIPAIILS